MTRCAFVLNGTLLGLLNCHHGRNFGLVKLLLLDIGQFCVDTMSDGVFSLDDVLRLPLCVQPRTILKVHLPALVACGAVESRDGGRYCIAAYHQYNPRSEDQLEAMQRRQSYWRDWKRQKRQDQAAQVAQFVQPHPEKNPTISRAEQKCPYQPTEPTKSERLRSETNPSSNARTKSISEVDSTKEKQRQGGSLTDFGATVAAFIQKVQQNKPTVVVEALSDEDMAVADQLASTAPPAKSTGKKKSDGEKLPIRLAKKPKTKTPLNEHLMDNALRELGLTPATPLRDAFWADMRAIGVCAEDVEYGVRETNRQKAVKHIRNPLAYTRKIVVGQEQARLGIVI